jgi:CRISPR type I-E-associated protein CasB/Cse2
VVTRLVGAIERGQIGKGDLAGLRRLRPQKLDHPAFWRILSEFIVSDTSLSAEMEGRWAVILSGLARMLPGGHAPKSSVGRTLANSGWSELRLLRFLRLPSSELSEGVRRLTAFLASKGAALNWVELANFLLVTDPEKQENARRRVARDYYQALRKKEKQS